jgi:IMP dehydrogenase
MAISKKKNKSGWAKEKKGGTVKLPGSLGQGLTFDDILLVPGYSEVSPRDVSTKTRLTKNISLEIPLISAAMDTVTEAKMAIAMAKLGGIGIIHKNMTIEEQAEEVAKVKRYESGRIKNPITLSLEATVGDALALKEKFGIGGFPVVNDAGELVGIVTNRDLRFEKTPAAPIRGIMTKKLVVGTEHTTVLQAYALFKKHAIEKLPLVDKKGKLVGLITYRDIRKKEEFPKATKDREGRLMAGAAIGAGPDALKRAQALIRAGADVICVDTAHGHSRKVIDTVRALRKTYPRLDIIGGNVATGEAAMLLFKAGASAIKVGIGPGSICTTRVVTGIGVPQLSAVLAVYRACRPLGIPVISDGGIKYSGDLVKALVFGADTVMSGGTFAGTDEAPGDVIVSNDRKFKKYRGMGSVDAMQKGSRDRYFQEDQFDAAKLVPEGVSAHVPYKGSLEGVVYQYIGGLRAGMGYLGAKEISKMREASFYTITQAGFNESHVHDLFMVGHSPNYPQD